ncbi:MAG: hypothetical protein HUU15_06400 [Candidatus Brocadiae bacterium]|nr:hypothetical protein [Candidatus Brocadiia bacterium]
MDIRCAPGLLEEAVVRGVLHRTEAGDASWTRDLHVLTDSAYLHPEAEREGQFAEAHALFFRKLGYGKVLETVVAEFKGLGGAVSELVIDRAMTPSEEEADLRECADGRLGIRILLRVTRFDDLDALAGFYRHELVHVEDMLNPVFGYRAVPRIADRPAEENLVRARLRLLWNLSIGGRVERSGKRGAATRAEWTQTAANAWPGFSPEVREAVVRRLWDGAGMTWAILLDIARDARKLLTFAGVSQETSVRGPGSLCPLCSFPTFSWQEDPATAPARVIAALKIDFPGWTPDQGACRQCMDGYELRIRFAPSVALNTIRD